MRVVLAHAPKSFRPCLAEKVVHRVATEQRIGILVGKLVPQRLDLESALGVAVLPQQVDHFTGIDLSPGMIKQARATNLYAELEVADMIGGLGAKSEASVNLVVAADAFVYLSDLVPVLTEARRVLVSGGVLSCTLETHDGDGVVLGEGLRYAHSANYVRGAIGKAGLKLLTLEPASPRIENNEPVRGLVVVAEKLESRR